MADRPVHDQTLVERIEVILRDAELEGELHSDTAQRILDLLRRKGVKRSVVEHAQSECQL